LGLLLTARRTWIIQALYPDIEILRKAGFQGRDALVKQVLAKAEQQ